MQLVFLALQVQEKSAHTGEPATAIDNQRLLFVAEFVPGNIQGNPDLAREPLKLGKQRTVFRLGPRLDRTFIQSFALVGNHQVEIEIDGIAKALASRASSIRIVKRKQAWLGLVVTAEVGLAFEALRKPKSLRGVGLVFVAPRRDFENNFARFAIADFDCIHNARALIGGDDQAIYQPKQR